MSTGLEAMAFQYTQIMFTLALLAFSAILVHSIDIPGTYGYIETNPQIEGKLFYWFFESQGDATKDPLVIWINGGPGCSSMMGLLTENGPFHVDMKTGATYTNKWGWNQKATYMAVDQPYGVGLSTANTDVVENDAEVQTEMLAFILGFYTKYPQYASVPLYVTGESFGGHYVPAIGSAVVQHNKQVAAGLKTGPHIPLAGLAIGNGWTDPQYQYAYQDFAFPNGLISRTTYGRLNTTYKYCADLIARKDYFLANTVCQGIFGDILSHNPGLNYYNIKAPCVGQLCYDFSKVEAFLNDPQVQKTLGVDVDFTECDDSINEKWSMDDRIESYEPNIRAVLAAGHKVMFYNGDQDLICNWVGEHQSLQHKFGISATLTPWTSKYPEAPSPAGWSTSMKVGDATLIFNKIAKSGHMAPMDQPATTLDMINRFLSGEPY